MGCSKLPDWLLVRVWSKYRCIKRGCDQHDEMYEQGGTEEDKNAYDKWLHDWIAFQCGANTTAQLFWAALIIGGKKHFNYKIAGKVPLPALVQVDWQRFQQTARG